MESLTLINQRKQPKDLSELMQNMGPGAFAEHIRQAPGMLLEYDESRMSETHVDIGPAIPAQEIPDGMLNAMEKSIRTCSELYDLEIAPRRKLVDDWFIEGDLGFLHAPRGLGKTWLALGLASALAAGKSCGPWTAHAPQRVLYVDGEMPCDTLADRIQGLGGHENLQVLNHEALFHLTGQVLNLATSEAQNALTEILRAQRVNVLVLDNLSCLFAGLSENDGDSWEAVLPWLLTLRRHRIAVVIVHHSGRNKTVMRGTSRREDAAFWVIRLEEVEMDMARAGASFVSRFTKDRNSSLEQSPIEWNFATGEEGRVAIVCKETSGMEALRGWVANGLTSAEDIAQEMGISKGTVSKMAQRAMAQGWLTKNGREYALVGDKS